MQKYKYRAWSVNGDGSDGEGIEEEILARDDHAAIRKAWSRAVTHLVIHPQDHFRAIRVEYLEKLGPPDGVLETSGCEKGGAA